jgi:hypothetical protein
LQQPRQNANDHDRIQTRRQQRRLSQSRRYRPARLFLLLSALRIDCGVDGLTLEYESGDGLLAEQEAELIVDAGEHVFLEFGPGVSAGRMVDEKTQGEGQITVTGKTDAPGGPQAAGIKAGGGGQGEPGGVVVEAAVAGDLGQEALQGLGGQLELLGQVGLFDHSVVLEPEQQTAFVVGKRHSCPLL